jgi:hypothetical protein
MSSPILHLTGSAIAALALSACAIPPDYSPHYVQAPVVSPERPHRVVRHELVPEACLTPDPTDTQLGPRLPPGCANNANLLAMVEHKRDVVHARGWRQRAGSALYPFRPCGAKRDHIGVDDSLRAGLAPAPTLRGAGLSTLHCSQGPSACLRICDTSNRRGAAEKRVEFRLGKVSRSNGPRVT